MTAETGTPITFSRDVQGPACRRSFAENIKALSMFELEDRRGMTMPAREPIGVYSLITP